VRVPSSPRALCGPSAGVGSNTWAGSAHPGPRKAGPAPRPASPVGESCKQASKSAVGLGPVPISARWPRNFKKIIFYFSFGFKLNSKFKNLYLNI
jgi:hypothetical protein